MHYDPTSSQFIPVVIQIEADSEGKYCVLLVDISQRFILELPALPKKNQYKINIIILK